MFSEALGLISGALNQSPSLPGASAEPGWPFSVDRDSSLKPLLQDKEQGQTASEGGQHFPGVYEVTSPDIFRWVRKENSSGLHVHSHSKNLPGLTRWVRVLCRTSASSKVHRLPPAASLGASELWDSGLDARTVGKGISVQLREPNLPVLIVNVKKRRLPKVQRLAPGHPIDAVGCETSSVWSQCVLWAAPVTDSRLCLLPVL